MTTTNVVDPLDFATSADANTNPESNVANANTDANPDNSTQAQGTDGADSTNQAPVDPSKVYPNVLRAYHGELPSSEEGKLYTVGEFAAQVTLHQLQHKGMDPSNIVGDQKIYTAVKSRTAPLPVVLVWPAPAEGEAPDTDERNAKVLLPWDEALKSWDERPKRGEGASSTSARTDADLLRDAAKKHIEFTSANARLEKLTAKVAKLKTQDEKYATWLKSRNISTEALEAEVAKITAEQEAAEENQPSEPDTSDAPANA
jgi:hypothetical protein